MKYILKKTGEPIKIGDTLQKSYKRKSSFGEVEYTETFTITDSIMRELISDGIVIAAPEEEIKVRNVKSLTYYLNIIANDLKKPLADVVEWLNSINSTCPKAVLDLLLQTISLDLYKDSPEEFNNAEKYYSLKPSDGTVGVVIKVHPYMALFKSFEDAEKAREVLRDQLNRMYGKQKDC